MEKKQIKTLKKIGLNNDFYKRWVGFLVMAIWLGSCGGANYSQEAAFDLDVWKNDAMGCKSERMAQVADFEEVRGFLEGKSELDIRKILGRPDKVELMDRSQKFYLYFLEKGRQCYENEDYEGKEGKYLYVRFTSLNEVNEIGVKQSQ